MKQDGSFRTTPSRTGARKGARGSSSTGEGGKGAQNASKVNSVNLSEPHVLPPKPTTLSNRCGGCEAEWSGTTPCHCARCHVTFSSLSAFVAHRPSNGKVNPCREAESVGLIRLARWYECWGHPAPDDDGFWASKEDDDD